MPAARGTRGGPRAAAAPPRRSAPVEVKIDWKGLTKRARQIPVAGDLIGGLTAAPTRQRHRLHGRAWRCGRLPGMYTVNLADGAAPSRVPSAPPSASASPGRGSGSTRRLSAAAGWSFPRTVAPSISAPAAASTWHRWAAASRLPRLRLPLPQAAVAAAVSLRPPPSPLPPPVRPTARQVTFTIHTELDHHALRKEVFLEGWRVMKNRFYDAKMHGADWNAARKTYAAVLDNLVDQEELHNVLMMMIGELNASHTGIGGGPSGVERPVATTRYPGFELVADPAGLYRVGHIWKGGPADKEYVKVHSGRLHPLHRRPRTEDQRQPVALPHPGRRPQVPFPPERQAQQGKGPGK